MNNVVHALLIPALLSITWLWDKKDSLWVAFRNEDFCSPLIKEVAKPEPKIMNDTRTV